MNVVPIEADAIIDSFQCRQSQRNKIDECREKYNQLPDTNSTEHMVEWIKTVIRKNKITSTALDGFNSADKIIDKAEGPKKDKCQKYISEKRQVKRQKNACIQNIGKCNFN